MQRPLIGLDLETTGVDPKTCGIVEIGLEIMRPGKPVKEYRTYVNPMMPIPPKSTAVHGITNETVQGAPTFAQLVENLYSGLTDVDLCGKHVWFDIEQLTEEFARTGRDWSPRSACVIDLQRLWQIGEPRTLDAAWDHFMEEPPDWEGTSHSALHDIKRTTRIIAKQLSRFPQLPRDLKLLHLMQWPERVDGFDVGRKPKLQWDQNGRLCFTFGRHKNKPLQQVPRKYLQWVVKSDFSEVVKQVCREALEGRYRERETDHRADREERAAATPGPPDGGNPGADQVAGPEPNGDVRSDG